MKVVKITIITLFPKMIAGFFKESIVKRAQEKGLVEINLVNLRDFSLDSYGTVDGRPYGGGAGMILRVEPIYKAIQSLNFKKTRPAIFLRFGERGPTRKKNSLVDLEKIILTSPKGKVFNQQKAIKYSKLDNLVIIAGHYEGVDERVRNFVDEEVSLGDFILTGGEIVATAIVDAVVRLVPGVLKKDEAVKEESFFQISLDQLINVVGEDKILRKLKKKGVKKVSLLEYSQYTKPEEFKGKRVPLILLSGNHKKIAQWRIKKAYYETVKRKSFLLPNS